MVAIESSNIDVAYFHCPLSICSAVSGIVDVDGTTVKLLCSLLHAYWVPIEELSRVTPYWPSPRIDYKGELYDADEACDHYVIHADGGGVRCTKCRGWFCL